MSEGSESDSRADFHRRHQAQAIRQAEQLLARRDELQGAWLTWVAGQLYQLSPPPYAAMVRRELQRLTQD
ncbi:MULTISPECIES: hypothetical protein [unclassified Pseudomonas]|uniref:hypothetical protein n=1 Tax=unclassified Pseudomonas TaxID=196821 RepID=UPI00244AB295|nr:MULTISPECIES: hypothetical protein [unclassified Pseudomonas]MDH0305100.1 hypothetical protein [Pseudomonas sp. GD04091]MDH1985528.1 hypothetical protein [Pseudomonas sp. GD03689]